MFDYFFVPAMFLPEGVGFSLYGPEHLCWLAVLAVMCVGMILGYRRLDRKGRLCTARWIATTLLLLYHVFHGAVGMEAP